MSKFDRIAAAAPVKRPPRKGRTAQPLAPIVTPRPGRPAGPAGGKRSDPDYTQITAYLRKDTRNAVKLALLQEGQGRDVSELVEGLLTGWLKERK